MERAGLKKGGKTPSLQGLFTHSDKGAGAGFYHPVCKQRQIGELFPGDSSGTAGACNRL